MKKVKLKTQAILLSALLFTAMIPTTAFASSAYEGATTTMSAKQASSSQASPTDSAQSTASDKKAEPAISKAKAEELVRKNVNIPEDYSLQGVNFSTNRLTDGTRNIWSLDFVKRVNGNHIGSIYTAIDADSGQLINFGSYNNNPNSKPSYPLKVERDAAQDIAASFMQEVAGSYGNEVTFNEHYGAQLLPALTGEVRHQFRFDREVNGIPFLDNYINVAVDSEGHVVEYNFVWDDTVSFPKVDSYLTSEQAAAKLEAIGEPQLSYILIRGGKDKGKPILSYELAPYAIHAVTGEKLNESANYRYRMAGEVSEQPVTDKPLSAKPKAGELKEEQALAKVTSAFPLPKGAELSNSSYNEYTDGDSGIASSTWNFSWEVKEDGKEIGSVWAAVDGQTGYVRSYYINSYSDRANQSEELIAIDKATSAAIDVVKKQLPWLTNELYIIKPDSKQYEDMSANRQAYYYISFVHKLHNANIDYDNVMVTIDARTGQVTGFDAHIQPYTYPSNAPDVVSKQEAMKMWMDYYRTELTYRVTNEYNWNGEPIPIEKYNTLVAAGEIAPDNDLEQKSKVELVYRLTAKPRDERVFLDAETGKWRTYENGESTLLERQKVVDAEGHWAQHQLELMVAYKALDVVDGKVRPNELIKRGELIKMLVIARNSGNYRFETANMSAADSSVAGRASFSDVAAGSQYFAYVEQALQQNLIDVGDGSFNPEGTVTREEMAELIVRALGYNSLAQYEDIFANNFKDSEAISNRGQATIVVGLNIMSLNKDGKFLPQAQVKRADAATAFFRYLQARADLQEAPLRM